MRIYIFLAFKSLIRSRLSLVLLILAVSAGVAFQIPNAANIQGYSEELLRQGVVRATGHVIISPTGTESLTQVSDKIAALKKLPFVLSVTSRLIHAGVVFRGESYQPARVVGLDPVSEDEAFSFCSQVDRGRCFDKRQSNKALVGLRLAEKLGLKVGDRIKITVPYQSLGEIEYASTKPVVAGIMRGTGGFQADNDIFISTSNLSRLMEVSDEATMLSVFVEDHRIADRYAGRIAPLVEGAKVEPWWLTNELVANAIAGNRTIFFISMLMVIFAVGIPVLSLLYIHVLYKRKQIATLAALGFSPFDLFLIYLCQAILIGVFGAGGGVILGFLLCLAFDAYPIYSFDDFVIRPALDAFVILLPTSILFLVTVVAGIAPALKASHANPSMELRED